MKCVDTVFWTCAIQNPNTFLCMRPFRRKHKGVSALHNSCLVAVFPGYRPINSFMLLETPTFNCNLCGNLTAFVFNFTTAPPKGNEVLHICNRNQCVYGRAKSSRARDTKSEFPNRVFEHEFSKPDNPFQKPVHKNNNQLSPKCSQNERYGFDFHNFFF